jgi:hypothetical protein
MKNTVTNLLRIYNKKYSHLIEEEDLEKKLLNTLREYNIKNSDLFSEENSKDILLEELSLEKLETVTKNFLNSVYNIESENFDRFEVDITPRYLGYGPDIHITAVFKGAFTGKESDDAQDLRWDLRQNIINFIPPLNDFDFGFSVSTNDIYQRNKIGYDELKKNKKITEELRSFNNSFLLSEASKIKVLTNKIGLNPDVAAELDRLCGPLSVWMANKLIDNILSYDQMEIGRDGAVSILNKNGIGRQNLSHIQGIMDFIRVGLDGNTSTVKNLTFRDLIDKSKEWHDSLKVSGGEINYTEPHTHNILIDNRDKDGFGFYWVDLNTHDSNEECRRMGHCGRTGRYNTIWSLRENKIYPGNPKYTINISHLTAAVGSNGTLYQLKGPKNSKPKDEYHNYITPLFYLQGDDGYLIQGFGSEYASERDFKITDLPNESIVELYKNRPDLFESYGLKRKLRELGLIEEPDINWVIEKFMKPHQVGDYVEGDWVVRQRKITTPAGGSRTEKIYFIETLLSGDIWDWWSNVDISWKDTLWNLDKDSEHQIMELIKKRIQSSDPDTPVDEDEELEDLIEGWDDDWEIRRALTQAMENAYQDAYYESYIKELKDTLSEYGQVTKMDYEGVKITIDVSNFIDDYREEYLDEVMENCDEDPECIFEEGIGNGDIDKPKFSVDDRNEPDINERIFNEVFRDFLSEVN